jgi:hypothetical protein
MISKVRNCVLKPVIIVTCFVVAVLTSNVFAQQNGEKPVSFDLHNQTMRAALQKLADENNINLTYNASDPAFDARVSFSVQNKEITEILLMMLDQINHTFQQVGNHLVIVRKPESVAEQSKSQDLKAALQSSVYDPGTPDTVFIHLETPVLLRDTVIVFDTIVKIEQQIILDTIFIEKPAINGSRARPASSLNNALRFEPDRRRGWAFLASYNHMVAGYQLISPENLTPELQEVKDSEAISARNHGLGAAIQFNAGNFSVAGSLSLTVFANRFYYSEIFRSGGFTKTDTLDVFYTVIQTDTIWKYVTDTTWVPLNREEILFDRMNRIGLLEANISAAFTYFSSDDLSLFARAGLHGGIPVWLRGNTIVDSEGLSAKRLSKEFFSDHTFGYQAGLGAKIKLSDWTDIHAEIYYKRYVSHNIPQHPLNRRLHGIGLSVGILYYL